MSSDTDFVSYFGRDIVIGFRRTQTASGTVHFSAAGEMAEIYRVGPQR
jgi:hypothetical protein